MYKNRIDIVHTGLSIHNSSNTRLLLYGTEKTEHRATTTTKSSKNEKMEKNVKNIKKKNKNEKKKNISLSVCAVVIMGHKLLAFILRTAFFEAIFDCAVFVEIFLQHFYIIFLYIIFFVFCAMLLPVYTALCVPVSSGCSAYNIQQRNGTKRKIIFYTLFFLL